MSRSTLVLALVAFAAAVVGYVEARRPAPPPPPASGPAESEIRDLKAQVASLRDEVRALRELGVAPAPDAAAVPSPGTEDASPGAEPSASRPEEGTPAAPDGRARAVRELLARLASGSVQPDELNGLWNVLPGSGLEDEALAAFRERVKANPDDPDAHYGLGIALTSKFLGGKASQLEIMTLSAQADAEFSKTLALDDDHFGARYSKAISYTFYPAIAGKDPEAIKQFEILVERHGGDRTNHLMEDVYFNLGKEYGRVGNLEKAKETYRRGLTVFPDSSKIGEALRAMD